MAPGLIGEKGEGRIWEPGGSVHPREYQANARITIRGGGVNLRDDGAVSTEEPYRLSISGVEPQGRLFGRNKDAPWEKGLGLTIGTKRNKVGLRVPSHGWR